MEQPKIPLPLSAAAKVLEVIGLILQLGLWYFTLSGFSQLPDIIPSHFRANGEVDGYAGKWTFLLLSAIATLLYLGLTLAGRSPHKMNYMVAITQENAFKQYTIVTWMYRVMKIAITIVFWLIAYQTVTVASGVPGFIGAWFMPLVFALVMAPVFYFLILSSKNS